jgi:RNA recognition motif-containing protein
MIPTIPGHDNPPNHTIYVRNLNEKVKLPALKNSLRNLFEQFGTVLDVVAHKNIKMRGQAFVVFESVEQAGKALHDVQGFPLYNKPMHVAFASGKSDAVAALDGTLQTLKAARLKVKATRPRLEPPKKKRRTDADKHSHPAFKNVSTVNDDYLPPNQILFVQNIPSDLADGYLVQIFKQYPGFLEVRLVPTHPGIAFVEYENEMQATIAKERVGGLEVKQGSVLRVTFAKR